MAEWRRRRYDVAVYGRAEVRVDEDVAECEKVKKGGRTMWLCRRVKEGGRRM